MSLPFRNLSYQKNLITLENSIVDDIGLGVRIYISDQRCAALILPSSRR